MPSAVQAGHLPLPFWSAYNVSKAGLDILSDCLRYELASQGIPVVLIKPGPVKTPIWDKSRRKSEEVVAGLPATSQELYGPALEKVGHLTHCKSNAGQVGGGTGPIGGGGCVCCSCTWQCGGPGLLWKGESSKYRPLVVMQPAVCLLRVCNCCLPCLFDPGALSLTAVGQERVWYVPVRQ